jgi:hypothetical protein
MEQRANAWVQRVYDLCCDAYKNRGKAASEDFDRAVWAYCVEPFIMGQKEADIHHQAMSGFLELLLCAVGSPREKRRFLTVSQKDCCLQVRTNIFDTWNTRLHHRLSKIDEAAAALARYSEVEARARRIVAGLPPDPPPLQPPTQTLLLPQPAAPPPHTSPVSSAPLGSLSARANEPVTPERPSALEPVLPPEPDTGGPWDRTAGSHTMTKKKFSSPLPCATIIGADIDEFVAWDGEQYVMRPTKDSVLADEGLKLIGSVRELSRTRRFSPGYVFVQNPSQEAQCPDCTLQDPPPPQPPAQIRLSALEPVLPPLSPAQEGPVAEAQGVRGADIPTQPSGAEAATWDTIEISFLSDERVQIRNGANSETLNYAEFGFEDGRSGKPNRAWEALRVLAARRGIIGDAAAVGKWPKFEKRVQEIRKVLRKHFLISADPIPFVEGTGYQALFKISCRPSFDT